MVRSIVNKAGERFKVDAPASREQEEQRLAPERSAPRRRNALAISGSVLAAALITGGLAWADGNVAHGVVRRPALAWSPPGSERRVDLTNISPVPTITLQPGERFVARAAMTAGGVGPAQSSDEKVLRRTHTSKGDGGSSLAEFEALTPGTATLNVPVTPFGSLAASAYGLNVRVAGIRAPARAPRGDSF